MSLFSILKEVISGKSVDYQALIKQGAVIVDVRTPAEFQTGHVKGSKNIPLQNLAKKISGLKNKEVILVCRSGGRAAQAKSILSRNGITAHNAGAWQRVNK